MDLDSACPMCKTTKYRNPSMQLMVNVCGHALCENCVDLLFAKGSGSCQECGIPLRRGDFRLQLFEDASIDKEVDIRRRILKDFCKNREDFESLREYNDYLEMVEDIIFNLCNNIDILETNKRIADYKERNREQIAKNRHKINSEMIELEDIMNEEKKIAELAKAKTEAAEKAEKKLRAQNKEKLIDDLMFNDGDASAIVAEHANRTGSETASDSVAKFSSGMDIAAASRAAAGRQAPVVGNLEGKPFVYSPFDFFVEGPEPPSPKRIKQEQFYKHIRSAEEKEVAAGYVENIACLRAVQEAMCGLYFSAQNVM